MILTHSQKVLDTAASDTLQRIQNDEQRAPRRIKPLLAYIHRHLFDPSLDVNQLKRGCGVRDNSLPIQFHAALGKPPHAYIEDCRLTVACGLLAESDLKVWKIAQLLGYSSIQVFSRAFTRWGGVRPTAYRKQKELAPKQEGSQTLVADQAQQQSNNLVQRALKGQLESCQARDLIDQLARLYPAEQDPPSQTVQARTDRRQELPPPDLIPAETWSPEALELLRIESISSALNNRSMTEKQAIIQSVQTQTPALFDHLLALSREVGREDRRDAIPMVQLALDSLDGLHMPAAPEAKMSLHARGWIHLANAYRLVSDHVKATSAIQTAERIMPNEGPDEHLQAYLMLIKASVLRDDDQLPEALEYASRGVELYRTLDDDQLLCQPLIAKAAIHRLAGDFDLAITDLQQAVELTSSGDNDYLKTSASHSLAFCYTQVGKLDEAAAALAEARQFNEHLNQQGDTELRLIWLSAVLAHLGGELESAEQILLEVHQRLTDLNLTFDAAVAGLDLAAVYATMGHTEKAVQMAAATLPIFDALKIRREGLAALGLLKSGLEQQQVTEEVLSKVRGAMARHINPPPSL